MKIDMKTLREQRVNGSAQIRFLLFRQEVNPVLAADTAVLQQ